MKNSKKLTLLPLFIAITAFHSPITCQSNESQNVQSDFLKKVIVIKNEIETQMKPLEPYIFNYVGWSASVLLASIIGFRKIIATVIIGGMIVGSNEIIKYLENAEKNSPKRERSKTGVSTIPRRAMIFCFLTVQRKTKNPEIKLK